MFAKSFEQNTSSDLHPKAARILRVVARDFLRSGNDTPDAKSKQLELAQAMLHMRIYQQFGQKSADIMPAAYRRLREMSGSGNAA